MSTCTPSASTSSARRRTSSSTSWPISTRHPTRSGSLCTPAAYTSSTPPSARASPGRCHHPSCRRCPAARSPGWSTGSAPTSTTHWVGRRVVAHLGLVPGGYAEQAVTAVDKLFPLPDTSASRTRSLPWVPVARRSASSSSSRRPPTTSCSCLSAAGGLGWLLVQGARPVGARVVAAAAGPERTDRLHELKPDAGRRLLDRRLGRARPRGDRRRHAGLRRRRRRRRDEHRLELLRPGGRHVMFGFSAGTPTRSTPAT